MVSCTGLSLLECIALLQIGTIVFSSAVVQGASGVPYPASYQAPYPSRETRGAPQDEQVWNDAQVHTCASISTLCKSTAGINECIIIFFSFWCSQAMMACHVVTHIQLEI